MKIKLWQFINAWQTCYGEDMREEYPGFIEKVEEAIKKSADLTAAELEAMPFSEHFNTGTEEETCPKCKSELHNVGLHNCWPYENWVCIKCNQEYSVELVRDWTTISEED